MTQTNDDRLKHALADVLGVDASTIDENSSMDTVPGWDSLLHLNLVLAIEEQFDVTLTEEQSLEIISYPLIKAVLAEHGVTFAA